MPDTPDSAERRFETSIELPAEASVVWRSLTDAEELKRWFALDARVTPGVGGEIWMSWGGELAGGASIEIFDAPHHLRWMEKLDKPWSGGPGEGSGPWLVAVDMHLEPAAGGGTLLRLVQSGLGKGGGWDDDLDSISHGWRYELQSLKHYLARHFGRDRTVGWYSGQFAGPAEEAWQRLWGSQGMGGPVELESLREDQAFRLVLPGSAEIAGRVRLNAPPRQFIGTAENLNDGLLRVMVERRGAGCMPLVWLATWGEAAGPAELKAAAAAAREQLERMLAVLFEV